MKLKNKNDPYKIYKDRGIRIFISNCLIEAIKAKIKNPNVKIITLGPKINDRPWFHFMWDEGDGYVRDFHIEWKISILHTFCYKGFVRKQRKEAFTRWLNSRKA